MPAQRGNGRCLFLKCEKNHCTRHHFISVCTETVFRDINTSFYGKFDRNTLKAQNGQLHDIAWLSSKCSTYLVYMPYIVVSQVMCRRRSFTFLMKYRPFVIKFHAKHLQTERLHNIRLLAAGCHGNIKLP